jgi:Rps23 Pro-64 3,4-dihydroxylase Tpa1-like proline 4-hydroxylase
VDKIVFIKDFLPEDLILQIKKYIYRERPQTSNHSSWNQKIIKDSARVEIFRLSDTEFKEQIINCYSNYFNIDTYTTTYVNYYKWLPGSFIPFHNDESSSLASTIYLNESWDKDYGGLFLYEEEQEIKGYVPQYNSAVINKNNVSHSTSIISPTAPKRETLQIFFE